jgi:hypothetical protein
VAAGGTLASGLKVYIADDGTAVLITKAASVEDYTAATTVSQSGQVIVVRGLSMGSGTYGADTLDSDNDIPVTLAVDAQNAAVSSITGLSKVPFVFPNSTYTLKTTAASNTQDDIYYAGGQLQIGNGSGGTDDYPIDPAIDSDVTYFLGIFLSLLVEDDLVTTSGGEPISIELTAAPATTGVFNTILGFEVPAITLADDFTLTGAAAIPTGTQLIISVDTTLTIDTGVVLTLDGGSIVLTNDGSYPAKIVFAGTGAKLIAGGIGTTGLAAAGGVFAAHDSTTQDVIPVSSFTELTITGDDDDLASIVYTSGTDPYITGPKSAGGSGATLSEDTDCTT